LDELIGQVELLSTGQVTNILFDGLRTSYESKFDAAGSKDEVDAVAGSANSNLFNNYNNRVR
jgi:hypothetical protein